MIQGPIRVMILPLYGAFRASERVELLPKCEKREQMSLRPHTRTRSDAMQHRLSDGTPTTAVAALRSGC